MKCFAIADLHLSFGTPNKKMDVFGSTWKNHPSKVKKNWEALVNKEDIVFLPGDFSWGSNWEQVEPDFDWISPLPGKKIFLKGNHDHWWGSIKKIRAKELPNIYFIQNDALDFDNISICGSRLWDTPSINFSDYIEYKENSISKASFKKSKEEILQDEKIFMRELNRLEISLKQLNPNAAIKVCLTHYPPIGPEGKENMVTLLLKKYAVTHCIYGHLHSVKKTLKSPQEIEGIKYYLTSCDYLDCIPQEIT